MRAFEAAARHCNFAKAGRELNLSPAAVSQQVKALEVFLGVALFERRHNTLELTAAGKSLLPGLNSAFRTITDAIAEVRQDVERRSVRLAAFPNFVMTWLLPRLPDLRQRMPDVDLEILTALDPFSPLFDQVDLAVRIYEQAPDYEHHFLFSATLYPVAAPSMAYWQPMLALEPERLLELPLLHLKHSPNDWQQWLLAAGMPNIKPRAPMWFDSQAVMMEAARQGLGVALARSPFDDHDVNVGRLCVLHPTRLASRQGWYLISPTAMRDGRASRVKDWILSVAAGR